MKKLTTTLVTVLALILLAVMSACSIAPINRLNSPFMLLEVPETPEVPEELDVPEVVEDPEVVEEPEVVEVLPCAITYIVDGVEAEGFLSNPTSYGTDEIEISYPLPQTAQWRMGYRFVGWYLEDGSNLYFLGTENTNGVVTINPVACGWSGNIILTGRYVLNVYEIIYDLDGGVNSPDNPNSYTYFDDAIIFLPAVREGYAFLGWYEDPDFEYQIYDIPAGTSGTLMLYARWGEL